MQLERMQETADQATRAAIQNEQMSHRRVLMQAAARHEADMKRATVRLADGEELISALEQRVKLLSKEVASLQHQL